MAVLNSAWYVLRDPARRAIYDASLRSADTAARRRSGAEAGQSSDEDELFVADPDDEAAMGVPVPGHARRGLLPLPWLLILVALAVIFVFTAYAANNHGGKGTGIDGVLQPGSCVQVTSGFVKEIGCDSTHDGVVVELPPVGASCPPTLTRLEDPAGSSTVCVRLG